MSHIINCKKKLVQRFFLFFDIFLLCKSAINRSKDNRVVPSYFSWYRATSDRVRFLLFRKQNWQCPVATINKFPLLASPVWLIATRLYQCQLIVCNL